MYESVTLVKTRKPVKITVPAGGWYLLFGPDQPLHQHVAARAKLVNTGPINDDIATIVIGRLQEASSPANFMTQAEADQIEANRKNFAEQVKTSQAGAQAAQKKSEDDATARREAERKAQVDEINRQHAKIHSGVEKSSAATPKVQIESSEE